MKLKQWQNIFHVIVNVHSIAKLVIQIKNGIMINSNSSIKIIIRAKKIIVGILTHVICENSKQLKHILMIQ